MKIKLLVLISIIAFLFCLNIKAKLIIENQPVGSTVCEKSDFILSVTAFSTLGENLVYNWYKDGIPMPNQHNSMLDFEYLDHHYSGIYYCKIYNQSLTDSITSTEASVYILTQTTITKEPDDVGISYGSVVQDVELVFETHGIIKSELIQWYQRSGNTTLKIENDNNFQGVNSNMLTINTANLADTSHFFAIVTGECGTDTTRDVLVIKNSNELVWIDEPEDISLCEGSIAELSVGFYSGYSKEIEFRWLKEGKPLFIENRIHGTRTNNLIINDLILSDSGTYQLEAKIPEKNISFYSKKINLTVKGLPKIICARLDTSYKLFENQYSVNVFFKSENSPTTIKYFLNNDLVETREIKNSMVNHKQGDIWVDMKSFDIDKNAKYWVKIENDCGFAVSDTLTFNESLGFEICDPFGQVRVVCEGESVKFNVETLINTNSKFRYQWYKKDGHNKMKNDEYIRGANSDCLNFQKVLKEHEGKYTHDVSYDQNDTLFIAYFGSAFSLKVLQYPTINRQPEDRKIQTFKETVLFNLTHDFIEDTIVASLYKFDKKSGQSELITQEISGFYGFSYTKNVTEKDQGYYYCELSTECGTTISDTIFVEILPYDEAQITTAPESIETARVYLWHANPFPTPSYNIVRAKIYWNLHFSIDNANLGLYDMFGGEIPNSDITVEPINAYSAYITWNCLGFNRGVYFIRVSLGGESMTIPVLVGGR